MQLPYLIIYGISTHFCDTTNPASEFTAQQSARFHTLAHALANHGIEIPIKHAANSATTLNHPENRFNLVRIGAAAYGLLRSTDTLHQTPIATWKTRIAFIRTIPTGSFVSYDLTYQTTEKTIIAILPIGYYNGYNRRLSNNSTVLVYNARSQSHVYAPVIGRIAMNHTIINVTHITDASTDDEVILMGPYEKITPYDIAQYTQSCNPREVTTTIHEAIPRTIVENSSEIGTISVSTASNEFCKQS
jgi:alanine racemase